MTTTQTTDRRYTLMSNGTGADLHAHGCRHAVNTRSALIPRLVHSASPDRLAEWAVRHFADNNITAVRVMDCCKNAPTVASR